MTAEVVDAGDGLPLTIAELLRARARAHGQAALVVCDDDVLSYAEAERRSAVLARGLLAQGGGKGTHVGLLYPNGSAFIVSWLAAARIGAVSVPLSTLSTGAELAVLLAGADVEMLLSTPAYRSGDFRAALGGALGGVEFAAEAILPVPSLPSLRRLWFSPPTPGLGPEWTTTALEASSEAVSEEVLAAAEDDVAPGDRLVIVHTSGSTSVPKGVIHAHGPLIRHLDNLNQIRSLTPGEVLFSNSPFFWIGGFAYALLGTLVAGARLVCSNSPSAAAVLDVLERERPTMVNGFAQSVAHLPADPSFAGRDLSSIRRGNLYPIMDPGRRPVDPELRHAMLGMTETGSVCLLSADEGDQPERRRGSFGRPAPGFEIKVVDPESGAACPPGQPGELYLRGPFLMEGYYGRERHEVFDANGWYASGDLVRTDEDGFVYFRGRLGGMIKTAGANVSPGEVEMAIADLTGLVCHVVGLEDAERGQIVAAVVVDDDGDLDVDSLRRGLAERLSRYKIPRRIVVVGSAQLPILSSGKVDLRGLTRCFDEP